MRPGLVYFARSENNMVWTEDDVRMGADEGMGRHRGWKERAGRWILAALLGMGILALGAGIGWYQMFYMPYCVRVDLGGREIDVEIMKRWEEREKDGTMGIIRMAGWRMENQMTVSAVGTGRGQRAQIIGVYGSMEIVEKASILSGRYGLAVGEDYCVLSESLARQLFGGVDVVGQKVKLRQKVMIVAGVIDKEGDYLLMPVEDGRIEKMAVEFRGRMGAGEKVEDFIGEVSQFSLKFNRAIAKS